MSEFLTENERGRLADVARQAIGAGPETAARARYRYEATPETVLALLEERDQLARQVAVLAAECANAAGTAEYQCAVGVDACPTGGPCDDCQHSVDTPEKYIKWAAAQAAVPNGN